MEYSEFIVKNLNELMILANNPWWGFSQLGVTWMARGRSLADDISIYCLLVTNLETVYFTVARTTQIQKEIAVWNR
jgi:hypothetical protein